MKSKYDCYFIWIHGLLRCCLCRMSLLCWSSNIFDEPFKLVWIMHCLPSYINMNVFSVLRFVGAFFIPFVNPRDGWGEKRAVESVTLALHSSRRDDQLMLTLFAPYWLVNKTGRLLQYRPDSSLLFRHPSGGRDPILYTHQPRGLFSKNKVCWCKRWTWAFFFSSLLTVL